MVLFTSEWLHKRQASPSDFYNSIFQVFLHVENLLSCTWQLENLFSVLWDHDQQLPLTVVGLCSIPRGSLSPRIHGSPMRGSKSNLSQRGSKGEYLPTNCGLFFDCGVNLQSPVVDQCLYTCHFPQEQYLVQRVLRLPPMDAAVEEPPPDEVPEVRRSGSREPGDRMSLPQGENTTHRKWRKCQKVSDKASSSGARGTWCETGAICSLNVA